MIEQTILFDALIKYPECKHLILHSASGMGTYLSWVNKEPEQAKRVHVWLYLEEGKVCAWAWVFQRKIHREARQLSFFVYSHFLVRKKGIAQKLFLEAKAFARQRHRRLFVYPWSEASEKLYNKLGVPKRNQLSWG